MRVFFLEQQFGDHADHAAAARQHFIGDLAHDADHRAAVDQADVALDQRQRAGLFDVVGAVAGIRTAIDAEILHCSVRKSDSLRKVARRFSRGGAVWSRRLPGVVPACRGLQFLVMGLGPAIQRQQRDVERATQFAQAVAHVRRHGAQILAQQQSVALEIAQGLRQHLLRDAVEPAQQFAVAQGPSASAGSSSGTHLPEISSSAWREGQAALKTSAVGAGVEGVSIVTRKCVLFRAHYSP